MKLVSIFFFDQRIYSVNFERIDNGPQCQIDNFDHYWQKNFQKNHVSEVLNVHVNQKKNLLFIGLFFHAVKN